jgi:hypothetical protein
VVHTPLGRSIRHRFLRNFHSRLRFYEGTCICYWCGAYEYRQMLQILKHQPSILHNLCSQRYHCPIEKATDLHVSKLTVTTIIFISICNWWSQHCEGSERITALPNLLFLAYGWILLPLLLYHKQSCVLWLSLVLCCVEVTSWQPLDLHMYCCMWLSRILEPTRVDRYLQINYELKYG